MVASKVIFERNIEIIQQLEFVKKLKKMSKWWNGLHQI